MKVNLVSDLHIDFDRARQLDLPGGEILLLAGDLCEVGALNPEYRLNQTKARLVPSEDDVGFGAALMSFEEKLPDIRWRAQKLLEAIKEQLGRYKRVYGVLGNHEHYNCNFDLTPKLYKEVIPEIILLENESVRLSDDVCLFGATLWSDLDKRSPFLEMKHRSWNDYALVTIGAGNRFLQSKDTLAAFDKTVAAIYKCAEDNPDQEIIVMTHFSPSEQSVPPRFKGHADNGFFYSSLEDVILANPNITKWCHGHMHSRSDYMIGQCRVMCNSRGYVQGFQEERTGFDPGFSFEI